MLNGVDCDFGVGLNGLGLPVTPEPSDALAVLDRYDLAQALVYDRGAFEAGDFNAQDRLLDYCARSNGRLLPTLHVVPPATNEQPAPAELIQTCLASGIRALRVSPIYHRFICDSHSMGDLLELMAMHRMPLLHSSMQVQDHPWEHTPPWRDIRDMALAFPRLPIVVLYTGMLQGRNLFPLLEQCDNVVADLTCFSFRFIEEVAAEFGGNRLVLASHFPHEDPGPYAAWVNYAGVSEDHRLNIAGGTMRRLLEAVQ
jgi:predicted TIM-barrel fold metal-dependent hydrolase